MNEREVQLFDGTRLLSEERFEAVKEETGLTNDQLAERWGFYHQYLQIVLDYSSEGKACFFEEVAGIVLTSKTKYIFTIKVFTYYYY